MHNIEPRWPCPVCLGVVMEKIVVGDDDELLLDRCQRCAGLWLEYGEVQRLRQHVPDEVWATSFPDGGGVRAQCHACQAHIDRDAKRCTACGKKTRLQCPTCQRSMENVRHGELSLDVCKRCKGVWFDRHEITTIWTIERSSALQRPRRPWRLRRDAKDGSFVLLDALMFAPDLVFYGAHGAGEIIAASADGLAMAPDAVGAVAEVAGEAASSVFEVIVEIVAGIFG